MRVWRIPLFLGLLSLVGLIAALLSEGTTDILWTAIAGLPLVVVAFVLVLAAPERK